MSTDQLRVDPHASSLEESVAKSLQDFGLVASRRYRVHLMTFIQSKGAFFPQAHIDRYCNLFSTALERELARTVSSYIEDYVVGVRQIIDTSRDTDAAAEAAGKAARQISLYLAALLKKLFEGCCERCLTTSNTCVYTFKELNELTGKYHSDVTARLKRHTIKLIELFSIYHRVRFDTEIIPETPASGLIPGPEKGPGAGQVPGSEDPLSAEPEISEGVPMEAFVLVDAFGRGLLGPLDIFFSIEDADPRVRNKKVFPRAFCAPLLAEIKVFLIGSDKYNSTNSALLRELIRLCSPDPALKHARVQDFFAHPKLKSYFTSHFLYMLKALLKPSKRENFLANVNSGLAEKAPELSDAFHEMHLLMLTRSWAGFALENIETVTARKAANNILKNYLSRPLKRRRT